MTAVHYLSVVLRTRVVVRYVSEVLYVVSEAEGSRGMCFTILWARYPVLRAYRRRYRDC